MSKPRAISSELRPILKRVAQKAGMTLDEFMAKAESDPEESRSRNGPHGTDSVVRVETIPADSPYLTPVGADEVEPDILRIAYSYLDDVSEHRVSLLVERILTDGWTVAEWNAAIEEIMRSEKLGRQITFDRGLTPNVFNMARSCPRVRATVPMQRHEAIRLAGRDLALFSDAFKPVRLPDEDRNHWMLTRPDLIDHA